MQLLGQRPAEGGRVPADGEEGVEVLDRLSGGTRATNIRIALDVADWVPTTVPMP